VRRLRTFLALPGADRAAFLEAWAWVCTSKLALGVLGLSRVVAWHQRAPAGAGPAAEPRAVRWIGVASRYCPGGASCLVRSLAVLGLLRRRGLAAQLRVGVGATAPRLEAHAWVELDGVPVNDAADVAARYPPFAGSLPGARFAS
jgi:hypothetical protein